MLAIIIAAICVEVASAQIFNLPSSDMPTATEGSFGASLTAQLFIDGNAPTGYVASVVCADPSADTYVLECMKISRPNPLCQLNPSVALTVTARPTDYELLYERDFLVGGSGTVTQSCVFEGPSPSFTQAVCSLSGWVAVGGRRSPITSTVETIASSDIPMTAVLPVTAGASNTASTCNPTTSSTTVSTTPSAVMPAISSSTESMTDAAPTGLVKEVYKVLVPVGAAAVGIVWL